MADTTTTTPSPTQKTIPFSQKIDKLFEEKKYYEAQQAYKTLYSRLRTQKKFNEAVDLLKGGILRLNQISQGTCASELGNLLVEALTKSEQTFDQKNIDLICELSNSFQDPVDPSYFSFMKSVLKWAKKSDPSDVSSDGEVQMLHELIGERYFRVGDVGSAFSHLVRSGNPKLYAQRLVQTVTQPNAFPSEIDLFLARSVLQYLCLGNLKDANILFETYFELYREHKMNNQTQEIVELDTPLLNFIRFLLVCLEYESYPLFSSLTKRYALSIQRDPSFSLYLQQIAKVFYNVQPPQSGFEGLLGNLMKSMFSK